MPFEVYERKVYERSDSPRAKLNARGLLQLNARAHALIGRARDVVLLFDPDERALGIRPAATEDTYTYRMGANGLVSIAGLLTAYGVSRQALAEPLEAELVDGTLVIRFRSGGGDDVDRV